MPLFYIIYFSMDYGRDQAFADNLVVVIATSSSLHATLHATSRQTVLEGAVL